MLLKSYTELNSFTIPENAQIGCLCFNNSGNIIACSDLTGIVYLVEAETGTVLREICTHYEACTMRWFSSFNSTVLFVGYTDGNLLLLETRESTSPFSFATTACICYEAHNGPLEQISVYTGGSVLLTASQEEVRIWDIQNCVLNLKGSLSEILHNAVQPNIEEIRISGLQCLTRKSVLVSYLHHGITCVDFEEVAVLWKIDISTRIGRISFSAEKLLIGISSLEGTIDIYDLVTGMFKMSIPHRIGSRNIPSGSYFIDDGSLIAVANPAGICVWDYEAGVRLRNLSFPSEVGGNFTLSSMDAVYSSQKKEFRIAGAFFANTNDEERKSIVSMWETTVEHFIAA